MQSVDRFDLRGDCAPVMVWRADEEHFAATPKLNFAKLFYLFLFGSVLGYLVETLYCYVASGHYVYRGSLIYGPLNTVYGIGALTLFFCLRKVGKRSKSKIFVVGAVAGTAVEFFCSWFQEVAFGTVSWDYSQMPLNIGGRVCLLYAVFWGALALAWVYAVYPGFEKLLHKIPDNLGRALAVCLLICLLLDIALSVTAVSRWMMRADGFPASGQLAHAMDRLFPDAHMERIYSSMKFIVASAR